MTTATVEMRLTLAQNIVQKLHEAAQARGVTEEAVVQQALDLLFEMDDTSPLKDYWFSVVAMRQDWDAMPEDWIADEVSHAIPTR